MSVTTTPRVSISQAILTPNFMELIDPNDPDVHPEVAERRMESVATFLTNLMKEACKALNNKKMRLFDANPGDSGCQLQAIHLHHLLKSPMLQELLREAKDLQRQVTPLKSAINHYKGKRTESPGVFFHRHFDQITLSQEMAFLFKMFLLTATKVKAYVEENGIIITRIDIGTLQKLSKNIDQIATKEQRNRFLMENAASLSEESTRFIQNIASHLKKPNPQASQVLSVVHPSKSNNDFRFVPRHHCCLFFQMEVILEEMKENQAFVAVKTIEKNKSPTYFFFQASEDGFAPISVDVLEKNEPLIVFEGVVQKPQDFLENVLRIGFEKMILTLAAKAPPFCSKSTLDDLEVIEAREKIKSFQTDEADFFLLDHVFCELVQHELSGGKK